jgi:hypothetical protein
MEIFFQFTWGIKIIDITLHPVVRVLDRSNKDFSLVIGEANILDLPLRQKTKIAEK